MARRRGRRGGGGAARGGVRGDVRRGNWVIGPGTVGPSGAFSSGAVWDTIFTVAKSSPLGIVLYQIPQVPNPAPAPSAVGEVLLQRVHGDINIMVGDDTVTGDVIVSMGIFISKFVRSTGVWDILDPTNQQDANRDDWLWLKTVAYKVPNPLSGSGTVATTPFDIHLPMDMRPGARIGEGEQLLLAVGVLGPNDGTSVDIVPALRTHISNVS